MNKLLFSILIGTLIILIPACASGERHIANLMQNLPHPDSVTLVYSLTGQGQGSQDTCFVTFFYGLYGTDKSYEEVAATYEDNLIADGWQRVSPDWRPDNGLLFERYPGLRLSIETEIKVSDIPDDTIKAAQAQYDFLYLIVITYRDWLARTYC